MVVLAPPLTITAAEVDEVLDILGAALRDVEAAGIQ
jgi:4-aminobutyrate aminotransferase-like enzyme